MLSAVQVQSTLIYLVVTYFGCYFIFQSNYDTSKHKPFASDGQNKKRMLIATALVVLGVAIKVVSDTTNRRYLHYFSRV